MVFKNDWERTAEMYNLPRERIPCMVAQAFPNEKLISQEVIFDGCANFNISICLTDNPIASHVFASSGFFDKDLNVIHKTKPE